MIKREVKEYRTKAGKKQYMPSMKLLMALGDYGGFCLACGEDTDGIEPDGRGYECPSCGEKKVYGREELVLMGVCW